MGGKHARLPRSLHQTSEVTARTYILVQMPFIHPYPKGKISARRDRNVTSLVLVQIFSIDDQSLLFFFFGFALRSTQKSAQISTSLTIICQVRENYFVDLACQHPPAKTRFQHGIWNKVISKALTLLGLFPCL